MIPPEYYGRILTERYHCKGGESNCVVPEVHKRNHTRYTECLYVGCMLLFEKKLFNFL